MRIAFLIVVLAGAIFYTYIAFADLAFLTRTGRLGPGFFPRLVGVSMVVLLIWATLDAWREGSGNAPATGSWRDVMTLMGLAIIYAVLLRLFGGIPATVVYLGLTLATINRGRHLQNVILTVTMPIIIYLLFDKLLNANMPPALFELPF